MHTLTIATSIYEINDQDIISNSMQCLLPQHSNMLLLPKTDSTFPSPTSYTGRHIGAVLSRKWGISQYYDVTLSQNLIQFFYLGRMLVLVFPFLEKFNPYLSQVGSTSQRPLEMSNLSIPTSDPIIRYYVYLITCYLVLIPPAQRLPSILRSDSVSK